MAHQVTLITGDGIGPELAEAARRCVDATGVKIDWDVQEAGVDVMERTGTPLPDAVHREHSPHEVRPEGPDHDAGRHGLSQHQRPSAAGVRPVRLRPALQALPGRPHAISTKLPVDLVIVRENTEDLYAGIEFEAASRRRSGSIDYINGHSDRKVKTGKDETGVIDQADQRLRLPSGSSASPSTTPGKTAARRSPPSTRRTS